jgi:hypothetical protein
MKNFALNLEKRMIKTFQEHQIMYADFPIQNYHQNAEVCAIAVQELKKEYDRFYRNRTLKEEISYYKECYPIVAKWQLYFHYLLQVEQSLFISHDELKIKTYKNCVLKLNADFKKKKIYFPVYLKMIQLRMKLFIVKVA